MDPRASKVEPHAAPHRRHRPVGRFHRATPAGERARAPARSKVREPFGELLEDD